MKRISNTENLYLGWIKAKKGKLHKKDVLSFEKNLDEHINQLQLELKSGKIRVGDYHYFTIREPKVRRICAASFKERVLHHAIMNICHPVFEKHLIYDSYATRKGKGTYAALDRGREFARKYKYFVKLDVRKYFDNIDHEILKNQLRRLFKDTRLLNVLFEIIDSYAVRVGKGIPIGNLTSQYFANHYVSALDHFAKEQLKLKGYIRYMDDIVFFGNDQEELKRKYKLFLDYLKTNLLLELKPLVLNEIKNGLPFLGYILFRHHIRLHRKSKQRFRRKAKKYNKKLVTGNWTEKDYQRHILPLLAFVEYADTLYLRKRIFWNIG